MSALARYFLSQGKAVAGYDRVSTSLTDKLAREGIDIHFEDRTSLIPDPFRNPERTLVIYTPAVPEKHQQLSYFRKRGFRVIKRSVALGEVFNTGRGIGVAGTMEKHRSLRLLPISCTSRKWVQRLPWAGSARTGAATSTWIRHQK